MSFDLTEYLYTASDLDQKVQEALQRLHNLHDDASRLKTLTPVRATPYYHKDSHGRPRYLWLIHPQRNGERVREYIGCKPEKIAAALARVQAHIDLEKTLRQAADIRTRLNLVTRYLAAALRAARGGDER